MCAETAQSSVFDTLKLYVFETRNMFCRTWSLSNATFSFWSHDVHPVENLLLCTKFHQNQMIFHWDMAIYRFSKWRPSAILDLFYQGDHPRSLCCWPQLPIKFHVSLIHRSEDIAIWIFRIFGLKCILRPPKWGGGDLVPLNMIIHHRDPQKAHPCVNPRLLSYQL